MLNSCIFPHQGIGGSPVDGLPHTLDSCKSSGISRPNNSSLRRPLSVAGLREGYELRLVPLPAILSGSLGLSSADCAYGEPPRLLASPTSRHRHELRLRMPAASTSACSPTGDRTPRSHPYASSSFASSSGSDSDSEEDESIFSYCSSSDAASAGASAPADDRYKTRITSVLAWRDGFAKALDTDVDMPPGAKRMTILSSTPTTIW
ncbi:uncharacterized protein BXZ73DRAFT_80880 [Epithele typhae]|uniref:uncharacterized protein n=1 Tax=Epithele typhae TaxID=378194 RepID=UPI0020081D29|nr:uncharacterized protein BXZ73DRAFT_80880 [Epithele typhae]KAH9917119.1 hypothetical protein BXZ73DRAFT_80880 [Epithele typhae]